MSAGPKKAEVDSRIWTSIDPAPGWDSYKLHNKNKNKCRKIDY